MTCLRVEGKNSGERGGLRLKLSVRQQGPEPPAPAAETSKGLDFTGADRNKTIRPDVLQKPVEGLGKTARWPLR